MKRKYLFLLIMAIITFASIVLMQSYFHNQEVSELEMDIETLDAKIAKEITLTELLNDANNLVAELENKSRAQENEIHNLNIKNDYLVSEKKYYRTFIDNYLNSITDNEKRKIASEEWKYYLIISYYEDGKLKKYDITDDLTIKSEDFQIILMESIPMFPIIDNKEIFLSSRIIDYQGHLDIVDYDKYNIEESGLDGTINTAMVFKIKNLNGSITLVLTDDLKERLELSQNMIMIDVE